MKDEKIIITVSGRVMSGKSRLSFMLQRFLSENGFDIEHEVSEDYHDAKHFNRLMSKNIDSVMNGFKTQRKIIIREEQLPINYWE